MNPDRVEKVESPAVESGGDDCAQGLSCLLDGEVDAAQCRTLVDRLRRDEDTCRRWELLNCVGDAMRSADVAAWHSSGFVARVSAALEREPTVLAPAAMPRRSGVRRWLMPGAGAAVAAALLVLVGLPARQSDSPDAVAVGTQGPPATTVAVAGSPGRIDRSPALERYLAAHRELADPTLMPYSTPYVRTSGAMPLQESR